MLRNIPRERLRNQQISRTALHEPAEAVAWLGAVQAQDYLGALWAVGLRTRNSTEASIEKALADRSIVRTWPMRGTLHFVAAPDVRWMLELLTPRVISSSRGRFMQLELDDAVLSRSRKLFVKALRDGRQLARSDMYAVLEKAGISTADSRGLHILWRLAHDGLLCFGARAVKQPTFALLEEWIPPAKPMQRDEALAELATRYFTSRGPATIADFSWWSGLPTGVARMAIEMAGNRLAQNIIGGRTLWRGPGATASSAASRSAYLLPPFDEYIVAYKDRSDVLKAAHARHVHSGGMFSPTIVVGGQVSGMWKRTISKAAVKVDVRFLGKVTAAGQDAVAAAAKRYAQFIVPDAALRYKAG